MKGIKIIQEADAILNSLYKTVETLEKIALYNKYMSLIRKAAYLGNAKAQYELGQNYEDIYVFGINPNCNYQKALYWYSKACEQGYASACNNLAALYDKGLGCEKDDDKALILFKKAMDLGDDLGKKNYTRHSKQMSKKSVK